MSVCERVYMNILLAEYCSPADAPKCLPCRSGDPGADWPLLQRLSFSNPEAFWPHLLSQLSMRFHTQPHR
jgi:hypothetical protein